MGTGTMYEKYWEKPRPSLRELEQLRVLAMYEFDPPLTSQELRGALLACDNRTHDAYEFLKASLRLQRIPASAPASMSSPEREREKRRMSASSVDDNVTPSKRRKERSFALMDPEEKSEEDEETHDRDATLNTQEDSEMPPTAADCTRAQQLLLQTVEDRVAALQPLRNPDWVNEVWAALQVPAVLELAMHLNLTVDALATWVKDVDVQSAQDIQKKGAALTVEVAASLPPNAVNATDSGACSPNDEMLTKRDEEVAEVGNEKTSKERNDVEAALETLDQKLASLAGESTREVKEAERALVEAKQTKETRSQQILEFVHKRHEELVAEGETEASASLQSVVEVWKRDDVEVQALWTSRTESEQRVKKAAQALQVANHALAFHKNLSILFRKVRERREEALRNSCKLFEETRTTSEAGATAALERFIPMLTRALCRYYEFHSIQQSKAKEELEEQEKALKNHNEFFGDSAPIKKGDIERRIREFIGVTQSSMQVIMEIAEGQHQLWEDKQSVLPGSVRLVLVREFKALWLELSGPMRDVMKKFVTTIEEAAGGVVAVEPPQQPAAPVFVTTTSTMDEQVIPAFTVPAFSSSQIEAGTPYRTAISAIVAPSEVMSGSSSPKTGNEPHSEPATQSGEVSGSSGWANAMAIGSSETRIASSLPEASEPHKVRHEFDVGSILYSKITVGESCTQFIRGVVVKQLDNGAYLMQYDNGDKFSVRSSFLFTQDLMEASLKAGGVTAPGQDTEMEDAEHKSRDGGCAIM
ncbi:DENN domain-containing protein 5A [Phytophthora cinnamomi]|uniref:DENN domain-containing protein 5A n=1 Tax=Phytophthora cinnamomi TaxID=4785 RepID=UPI003559F5B5|nr:DENN domain-containing protein 5A [Phytophthora cinnamomi]